MAEVLTDPARKKEYEGGLEEATELSRKKGVVKELNQPAEWMEHKLYHIAPPLDKRDYVFKCTWIASKTADGKASYTLAMVNADAPSKPASQPGVVRGWVTCSYTLVALTHERTELSVKVNLDPMGNFPLCLAKLYGSAYPGMALKRVKMQSLKVLKEKSPSGN